MAPVNAGSRRPSGGIAGRISTRSGATVAGAPVMIVGDSPAHLDIAAITNASGDYQFGGLTPGDYEIQANVGDRLRVQRVRVSAGEIARLDFVAED
jgi:Carboxypeptidase regulatory-like domain